MDRAGANKDAGILSIVSHVNFTLQRGELHLLIKIRSEAGNNDDFYLGDCRNNSLSCQGITLNRLIIFATMQNGRSVALHTPGCKLNYSETSAIERLLVNAVL